MWETRVRQDDGKFTMTAVRARAQSRPVRDDLARRVDAVAVICLAAAAVVTLVAGASSVAEAADSTTEGALPRWLLAVVAGGTIAAPVVAWSARALRSGVATGLGIAAIGVIVPWWSGWSSVPTSVGARALAAAPLAVAGTVHVALCASSTARLRALAVVHGLCATAALVMLGAYDPFHDPSCVRACERVHPVLGSVVSSTTALATAELLTLAAAAAGGALVVRRLPMGSARSLVSAAACSSLLVVVSRYVRFNDWPSVARDPVPYILIAAALVLPLISAAALTVRTTRTRSALDRLLAQLGDSDTLTGRRDRTIVAVQVSMPEDGRWVDLDGAAADEPSAGTRLLDLPESPGAPRLRLVLAPGAAPEDLATLTAARRLALASLGLAAVTRAHTTEVRESQQRVVSTADAERRRIERDLHDGAQQRLVSVAFHLSSARHRVPSARCSSRCRPPATRSTWPWSSCGDCRTGHSRQYWRTKASRRHSRSS